MKIKDLINQLARHDLENEVLFKIGAYDDAGYFDYREAELTRIVLQFSSSGDNNVVILEIEE